MSAEMLTAAEAARRNDLLGERIGRMFAAARTIAEARGARDEWDKHYEQVLAGSPAHLRALPDAAVRWAKRKPVPAEVMAALFEVERLAEQIGDLPAVLPMAVRSRIIRAGAASRTEDEL